MSFSRRGFTRIGGSPEDRSVIPFYAEAGLAYKGLVHGRENDNRGVSIDYARISNRASRLEQDKRFFTGNPLFPTRNHKMALELTYQAQVTPWLLVQPDVQYVIDPDCHVLNADGSVRQNALVFGLRSAIRFQHILLMA